MIYLDNDGKEDAREDAREEEEEGWKEAGTDDACICKLCPLGIALGIPNGCNLNVFRAYWIGLTMEAIGDVCMVENCLKLG